MISINKRFKGELIIKNSKFITIIDSFYDDSNLDNILNEVKEKYPKATHYCYAYITEHKRKSSDDKEPSGTAGTPILNVLEKENMINIIAIVIRYFGGIKLGVGGLVRAYSKSVKDVLKISETIEVINGFQIEITFPYNEQKNIDYILKNRKILNKEFKENIIYTALLNEKDLKKLNNYKITVIKKLLIQKEY